MQNHVELVVQSVKHDAQLGKLVTAHGWSRFNTIVATCDAHMGWNAPQPRVEVAGCNHEERNLVNGETMVDADDWRNHGRCHTMPALVVVSVPDVRYFGSRIDGHDDPTPNRDVLKEELERNADVQRPVEVRDDQFLRRRSLLFILLHKI